jgi:hypothetical protein
MHSVKYDETQIIEQTLWQVPPPTYFGTEVPSSESLIKIKDCAVQVILHMSSYMTNSMRER